MAKGQFAEQMRRIVSTQKERIEYVRRRSIIALFDMVVLRTPVDTGRLRGNWVCTIGGPNAASMAEIRSMAETKRQNEAKVNESTFKDVVYLTNNLTYAVAIEYGHSAQAPQGMMRVSAAQWPAIVKRTAKRYQ